MGGPGDGNSELPFQSFAANCVPKHRFLFLLWDQGKLADLPIGTGIRHHLRREMVHAVLPSGGKLTHPLPLVAAQRYDANFIAQMLK